MGFFDFLRGGGNALPIDNLGDTKKNNDLTYYDCKDIFRNHALGKRLALALPTFSLSTEREITVKNAPPDVVDLFNNAIKKLNIIDTVKRLLGMTRAYGMCALYVAIDNKNPKDAITYKDIWSNNFNFNVLDPLNLAGVYVNQDPSSTKYQQVETILVNNSPVNPKRALILQNDYPLYLMFSSSTFSFSGASIYQNMQNLLIGWETCIKALNRMAVKAGSIIVKNSNLSHVSGVNLQAIKRNLEIINSMENDGIASIDNESSTEFFGLTGVVELDKILDNFNKSIALALQDTPLSILLDSKLSNGLNDGSEDLKTIIMAVNSYRNNYLQKVFNFIDPFIMAYAWNENELLKLKKTYYTQFKNMDIREMFSYFRGGFSFDWGELYPIDEKSQLEIDNMKMNLLMGARELGANMSDISAELKRMDIFNVNMDLLSMEQNAVALDE